MTAWTAAELDAVGSAVELSITTRRPDGNLRPAVPIWVVRVGDEGHLAAPGTATSARKAPRISKPEASSATSPPPRPTRRRAR